jgi:hypothetical protein
LAGVGILLDTCPPDRHTHRLDLTIRPGVL